MTEYVILVIGEILIPVASDHGTCVGYTATWFQLLDTENTYKQ